MLPELETLGDKGRDIEVLGGFVEDVFRHRDGCGGGGGVLGRGAGGTGCAANTSGGRQWGEAVGVCVGGGRGGRKI